MKAGRTPEDGGGAAGTLGMRRSIQEEGGGELASGRQSDLRLGDR